MADGMFPEVPELPPVERLREIPRAPAYSFVAPPRVVPAQTPRTPLPPSWIEHIPALLPQIEGRAINLGGSDSRPKPSSDDEDSDDADRVAAMRREKVLRAYAALRALAARTPDLACVLWVWHALTPAVLNRDGNPEPGVAQEPARAEALAFGAAPTVLRASWRLAAAETPRVYGSVRVIVEHERVPSTAPDGTPTTTLGRETARREIQLLHMVDSGAPAFDALATAWARERLSPLWSPLPAPSAITLSTALGFAPSAKRTAWEKLRGVPRRSAVLAWARGAYGTAHRAWDDLLLAPSR